jgi:hypothetical protein
LIIPVIAQRGEELVQQIAVRRVDFEDSEARGQGTAGGGFERVDDPVDAGFVERLRDRAVLAERDRAGPDDRPAALLG